MKNKMNFKTISDQELNLVSGGKNWWKGIDAILSPLQSTPSWVQGKHPTGSVYPKYTPGGGPYYPTRF